MRSLVELENASVFDDVDVEAEALPLYVRGTLSSDVTDRVSLAISVNGVVVATTVSYTEGERWVFASMIPQEALAPGANEVQVVMVGGVSDDLVLEPVQTLGGEPVQTLGDEPVQTLGDGL